MLAWLVFFGLQPGIPHFIYYIDTHIYVVMIYIYIIQSLGGARTHFVPLMKVRLRKGFASSSDNILAYSTRPNELEPGPIHLYSP